VNPKILCSVAVAFLTASCGTLSVQDTTRTISDGGTQSEMDPRNTSPTDGNYDYNPSEDDHPQTDLSDSTTGDPTIGSERIVSPPAPDNDCMALFHFDNPSPFADSCGRYSLTNEGARPYTGQFGEGLDFNGGHLYSLSDLTRNLENQLTVEAWIKPHNVQNRLYCLCFKPKYFY